MNDLGRTASWSRRDTPIRKRPDQEHFLRREKTKELFRQILRPSDG